MAKIICPSSSDATIILPRGNKVEIGIASWLLFSVFIPGCNGCPRVYIYLSIYLSIIKFKIFKIDIITEYLYINDKDVI